MAGVSLYKKLIFLATNTTFSCYLNSKFVFCFCLFF